MSAVSAEWFDLKLSSDHIEKVDLNSITQDQGYVKAWFSSIYSEPQLENKVKWDQVKYLMYINCQSKKFQGTYYAYYLGNQSVNFSRYNLNPYAFLDVVPDSIAEAQIEFACAYSKNQKVSE